MFSRCFVLIVAMVLPFAASATNGARHLSREELIALAPSPDIRPTFDAGGQYSSGGIGILIYEGVNAMDALGPYQTFSSAGLRPMLISASKDAQGNYKSVITSNSGMQMTAHRTMANTTNLEVLVVPGGAFETAQLATNTEVLNWIKDIDRSTLWTTSVCTGSWVLGAAGLLQGKKATSNWYHADELLAHFGAIPKSRQRYVFDGKIITGAGVTAGIDMALALIKTVFKNDLNNGRDYTQAIMLELQYDPNPPVKGGSPEKTDPVVFDAMQWMYDYFGLADFVKTIPIQ
jgi:transcriptional regulator GlxA family with amidase domain